MEDAPSKKSRSAYYSYVNKRLVTFRLPDEEHAVMVRLAAKADRRSMSRWFELYVLPGMLSVMEAQKEKIEKWCKEHPDEAAKIRGRDES